ncbi:MAG: Biopolymer transport protein ExbD/TolR [Bacteroidetes bacterium]|jgi:biopolymer transport protein ExbD|nr:Biopolymer transport protein ExbD/TolR [Bacteroidota bacterium]
MSGGDVAEPKAKGKGKKRKKGRRLGIRIDMTPLVDVAFLLLTFFMFTTSMSRPQTMEINLPPDKDVKVEVAESNLMTLRVTDKADVFWSMGIESPKRIAYNDLQVFLRERIAANPKLIVVLKIDRMGKYNTMVNLIDELTTAQITRFSLAPMSDKDKELVANVKA